MPGMPRAATSSGIRPRSKQSELNLPFQRISDFARSSANALDRFFLASTQKGVKQGKDLPSASLSFLKSCLRFSEKKRVQGNPNVRVFAAFTEQLDELIKWLKACGVTTVAMESTGVYWIALHQKRKGVKKGSVLNIDTRFIGPLVSGLFS